MNITLLFFLISGLVREWKYFLQFLRELLKDLNSNTGTFIDMFVAILLFTNAFNNNDCAICTKVRTMFCIV